MNDRVLAHAFYQNLENICAFITPPCIETHKATIADTVPDHERIWRKKTNALLVEIFFELVVKNDIDFFVEIGAFDGCISQEIEKIGIKNCLAFEANPYTYSKFKNNFINSTVKYLNFGISDRKSNSELKIPKHSSELELANSSYLNRREESEYTTVETQTISINSILEFLDKPFKKGAAWIDVEGLTHKLIEADTDFFECIELIFLEVEDFSYWKEQRLVIDILESLLKKNFIPLLRDYEGRGQYNILFVKSTNHVIDNSLLADYSMQIRRIPHACQEVKPSRFARKSGLKRFLSVE